MSINNGECRSLSLDRGVFTISLDFELIWGTLDNRGPERFRESCTRARVAVERLLNLFTEFDVSATWCTLGHLFLDRCECDSLSGVKHPEIVRPQHAWCRGDWFQHDPGGTEETAPTFFARSLVEKIRACQVPQEIGSHSFSHIIFGDAGCSRAAAESDLAACVRLADEMGIAMRSFAFPRNSVGHLDVLREHGFRCYRGPEPHWYDRPNWPVSLRRLASLLCVLTAAEPPVVLPREVAPGFWDIPGSLTYFPMHGPRRFVPMSIRVRRAVKGLDAAARRQRIFHFWFHPMNLAEEMDALFAGLRRILEHAARLRSRRQLDIWPMAEILRRLDEGGEPPESSHRASDLTCAQV